MTHSVGPPPADGNPTTYALIKKRADLSGEIRAMKLALRRKIAALDHIDYTIHIFDPTYEISTIHDVPKLTYSLRGDSATIALDALRVADRPLNTEEVAIKIVQGRGLDAGDPKIVNLFRGRASGTLQAQLRKGLVRVAGRLGKMNLWELVR